MFQPQDIPNNTENDAERSRRQQLLRIGLILFLLIILFDGGGVNRARDQVNHGNNANNTPRDEILIPNLLLNSLSISQESKRVNNNLYGNELNITGFYRGLIGNPNARSPKSNTSKYDIIYLLCYNLLLLFYNFINNFIF
jgi:hypothetical protein